MKIEITPCELVELLSLIESPVPKTTTIKVDGEKFAEKVAKVTENIANKNKADHVEIDLEGMAKRAREVMKNDNQSVVFDNLPAEERKKIIINECLDWIKEHGLPELELDQNGLPLFNYSFLNDFKQRHSIKG